MPAAGDPTVTTDLADVVELVVRHYDIRGQLPDPVVDSSTLTLRVTGVRVPEVRATLDVTDEGLEVFVQIGRLEADTEGSLDLAGEALDLGGGIHAIVSAYSRMTITKPAGAPVEVTVRQENGNAVVRVRDHGEGIRREDMPRLFKKFSQLDSRSTRKVGGTGLGLAICKGIVEAHGGRIWAESEPGEGSTFAFTIPLAIDAARAA